MRSCQDLALRDGLIKNFKIKIKAEGDKKGGGNAEKSRIEGRVAVPNELQIQRAEQGSKIELLKIANAKRSCIASLRRKQFVVRFAFASHFGHSNSQNCEKTRRIFSQAKIPIIRRKSFSDAKLKTFRTNFCAQKEYT